MPMSRRLLIPALLAVASLLWAQTPATPAKAPSKTTKTAAKKKNGVKGSKAKAAAKQEPPKVEPPPAPVAMAPPTLAQQAPVLPRVTYQGGLLTIDAPNSTLGDILNSVKKLTNASIDGPQSLGDRVVVHLGPGQPRDVLHALLSGSRFDYVLMGTPQQPNGISKIVLIARAGGPAAPQNTAASANPRPAQGVRRPGGTQPANTDEENDEEDSADRDENAPQPAPPQQQQQAPNPVVPPPMPPDQNAPQNQEQNPNAQPNQPNPNQPKTPEQLYQELQNLERQRQQPQNPNGQQPPPNGQQPPPQ